MYLLKDIQLKNIMQSFFIKDLGLYYEELYTNLSINVKYEVWENISYFTIYILSGIDEIIQNINSQG